MSIPHLLYVGSEKPCSVFLYLKKVAMKAIKKNPRIILTVALALFFPHVLPGNEWQHSLSASQHPIHSQPPAYTPCPGVGTSEAGFPFAAAAATRAGRQAGLAEGAPLCFLSLHPLHEKEKRTKRGKICITVQGAIGLLWCLQPS